MKTLEAALDIIRAIRPGCPALKNLIHDCRGVGLRKGESEGLRHAAMLLKSVRFYQTDHEKKRKPLFGRIE